MAEYKNIIPTLQEIVSIKSGDKEMSSSFSQQLSESSLLKEAYNEVDPAKKELYFQIISDAKGFLGASAISTSSSKQKQTTLKIFIPLLVAVLAVGGYFLVKNLDNNSSSSQNTALTNKGNKEKTIEDHSTEPIVTNENESSEMNTVPVDEIDEGESSQESENLNQPKTENQPEKNQIDDTKNQPVENREKENVKEEKSSENKPSDSEEKNPQNQEIPDQPENETKPESNQLTLQITRLNKLEGDNEYRNEVQTYIQNNLKIDKWKTNDPANVKFELDSNGYISNLRIRGGNNNVNRQIRRVVKDIEQIELKGSSVYYEIELQKK